MKNKKAICSLVLVIVLILCSAFPVFATSDNYTNTETFWGYSTDYGTKAWKITTRLDVDYSGTSSTARTITKIWTSAINDYDHSDDDLGNGTYGFTGGIKTYAGSTKLGTDYPNSFTTYSVIKDPSDYLYFAKAKTVSYRIPAINTGKVVGYFAFNNSGWIAVDSWANTLTNSIY